MSYSQNIIPVMDTLSTIIGASIGIGDMIIAGRKEQEIVRQVSCLYGHANKLNNILLPDFIETCYNAKLKSINAQVKDEAEKARIVDFIKKVPGKSNVFKQAKILNTLSTYYYTIPDYEPSFGITSF